MLRSFVLPLALVLPMIGLVPTGVANGQSAPQGAIDPNTVVTAPQGTFNGVAYSRYEAMFQGVTSDNHPFRVPCQIIAPTNPSQGSGLLLFDWLVATTIATAVGQEQADARYTMGDEFLFGRGLVYATVRCDQAGIGRRSVVSNPLRPWSDGLLDTTSEFITSAGDEFEIVVSFLNALRSDPIALQKTGAIQRRAAFSYSTGGFRLRGLLRSPEGVGQFHFSLVGGTGKGFMHPTGNGLAFSNAEKPPRCGAGLEIDFQSETDVLALDAHKTRHEEANYRCYQFAGAAHLRAVDAAEFGLADPASANTADWTPFFRTFFVVGNNWCDGILPPPSLWLGAPNDATITRDANGNALVRFVGRQPFNTTQYRLPAVAVGENQYIPFAPAYIDGTLPGQLRALAGGHIDRTASFTSHASYVAGITQHAAFLQAHGYLLAADASAIIQQAQSSNIGN